MVIFTYLIAILLLIVSLASCWYFIKTLLVIINDSTLMGVISLLFAPIGHIIWYVAHKTTLNPSQRQDFRRLFISYLLMIILTVAFGYLYFKAVSSSVTVTPAISLS